MTDTCCDICGDLLNDKCVIKLNYIIVFIMNVLEIFSM